MHAEGASAIEEVGIDIIKVDRIRRTLERFGPRFSRRVLTSAEARYVNGATIVADGALSLGNWTPMFDPEVP